MNDIDRMATLIVDSLFTNGSHEKASRLLLVQESGPYAQVVGGKYLGGLSEQAVRDRVKQILASKPSVAPRETKRTK